MGQYTLIGLILLGFTLLEVEAEARTLCIHNRDGQQIRCGLNSYECGKLAEKWQGFCKYKLERKDYDYCVHSQDLVLLGCAANLRECEAEAKNSNGICVVGGNIDAAIQKKNEANNDRRRRRSK